jgi:hypothetical protein
MSEIKGVYGAIAGVMADLSAIGIGKDSKNEQQGFFFRGIDAVYNTLSPILSARRLVVLPRVLGRSVEARKTAKGGDVFNVTLDVEFDIVFADDGSVHTVRSQGEANDSQDKATNKAMSAAYKYMAIMAFCIPVEGMEDADASSDAPAIPAPLPANVSEATRKKEAGQYLSKTIQITPTTEGFKTLKSITGDAWPSLVLDAEQLGITTLTELLPFVAMRVCTAWAKTNGIDEPVFADFDSFIAQKNATADTHIELAKAIQAGCGDMDSVYAWIEAGCPVDVSK